MVYLPLRPIHIFKGLTRVNAITINDVDICTFFSLKNIKSQRILIQNGYDSFFFLKKIKCFIHSLMKSIFNGKISILSK